MRCIEIYKHIGYCCNKNKINRNMRCIEMVAPTLKMALILEINRNMRCIEIFNSDYNKAWTLINRNMRCIEMPIRNGLESF